MSDIRRLIRDIQCLIKAIKQQPLTLSKDLVPKIRITYVLDGEKDYVVYKTSDTWEAALRFLDDVNIPEEIRDIVIDVITGEKWFEITEVDNSVEATNTWKKVREGQEGNIHLKDEGVFEFEVGNKPYKVRVEKDKDLILRPEDIEKLVSAGLTGLSADAVEEPYWSSADRADDEWGQEGKWREPGQP